MITESNAITAIRRGRVTLRIVIRVISNDSIIASLFRLPDGDGNFTRFPKTKMSR